MGSNTLDELGRATLEAIAERRVTADALETELDADREAIDDRLAQLVDNALVRRVAAEGDEAADDPGVDGAYELTENGRRVLEATPVGARDYRIDTPDAVEQAIEGFDLRPDEASAVRSAFSFLRYWEEATTAEIVDATYSEVPAGYGSADRWWDDCVRDRLAALPDVRARPDDPIDGTESWTYDGTAAVEPDDRDGRAVADPMGAPPPFASARHAIERARPDDVRQGESGGDERPEEDDVRAPARAAFAVLFERGRATTVELLEGLDDEGVDAAAPAAASDDRTDRLAALLDSVPGVERGRGSNGETVWTYDPSGGVDGRSADPDGGD
ncbi:hypothetical protein [Halovivax limisalsi]|uniref:hypothetical protein n=1 Tax=Halovivax limisalsi TaxID=1453760 RepID=UPI001FFD6066|nr:hypothetical protein [Halovivax limisalsi]